MGGTRGLFRRARGLNRFDWKARLVGGPLNFPSDSWSWLGCGRLTALPQKRSPSMSKNIGPYTPVVRAGDLLFVSGQIGIVDGSTADGPVAGSPAEGGLL